MAPRIAFRFADEAIERAARVVAEQQIRRLPILDRDERLAGIVAMADLARTTDDRRKGEVLEQVSEPTP